jgi:hypothetical protein
MTIAKATTSVFGRVLRSDPIQQAAVTPGHEGYDQAATHLKQVKSTLAGQAL